MISNSDKTAIISLAKKYKITRLLLFCSNLDESREANDIDLAVEGLPENLFFKFYSELIFNLSKPVDLIDLERKSRFRDVILQKSINLYG